MRTSLNEIKLTDDYVFGNISVPDKLLFDALLILNQELADKVQWQKEAHAHIRQFGRKKLKAEIEAVHHQLFSDKQHLSFGQKILRLFK